MSISTIPNLARLVPMQGVAYTPVPSDDAPAPPQKYFDTDFTNSSFPLLWGSASGGRGDIGNLSGIGVNFVHLYDWSVPPAPGSVPGAYQRDHLSFLQECSAVGVNVFVPISNYFMEQIHQGNGATVKGQIQAMVTEVYNGGTTPVAGAGMWGIANEFDLAGGFDVNDVVQAMAYLVEIEQSMGIQEADLLPVTSPVSFAAMGSLPPAITAIQNLKQAVEANSTLGTAFWNGRFVAAMNSFNDGTYLANYIATIFPQYFPDLPFFLSEMGINLNGQATTEQEQAQYVLNQLNNTVPSGNFLGRCVFQFLNQTAMKTGTEATFGMTKYCGQMMKIGTIPAGYIPGGGETYPVDGLTQKPLYQSVVQAYKKS